MRFHFQSLLMFGTFLLVLLLGNSHCSFSVRLEPTHEHLLSDAASVMVESVRYNKEHFPRADKLSKTAHQGIHVACQGSVKSRGIAVDPKGHFVVVGTFKEACSFGATTLKAKGKTDIFAAKLDEKGVWLWANSAGSTGEDFVGGVAIDNKGNIAIVGAYEGLITFGKVSYPSKGEDDLFVAQLSEDGKWKWVKTVGSKGDEHAASVVITSKNQIVFTGHFENEVQIAETKLTSSGSENILVAKLDDSGRWLWARRAGGDRGDHGCVVELDAKENIVVAGQYYGAAVFDKITLGKKGGDGGLFVAKLDHQGRWLWAMSIPSEGWRHSMAALDLTIDRTGSIYFAGCDTVIWQAGGRIFGACLLYKVLSSGKLVWESSEKPGLFCQAQEFLITSENKFVLVGNYEWSLYIGKTRDDEGLSYNGAFVAVYEGREKSDSEKWTSVIGFSGVVIGGATWDKKKEHVVVVGDYGKKGSVEDEIFTSKGDFGLFVMKILSKDGKLSR